MRTLALCFLLLALPAAGLAAEDLSYSLPTDNDAIYRGDWESYLMYCDRNFEGQKTQPWEAGGYGMVRTPIRVHNGQIIYTRLHEGIDIKPTARDSKGNPLDTVRPIAPGIVAYTNEKPGASNYGRYVVIAHRVPEGTIYSLYAHLASVACKAGQKIKPGDTLGIMGYSGAGINRVRAHCHVELCLMIHASYDLFCPADNKHGLFNGMNLAGFDLSEILLASQGGKTVSLASYFATLKEHYRVRVPRKGTLDLLRRHPFLYRGDWKKPSPSLEIAFTAEGVPIAVYPSDEPTTEPVVSSCRPMPTVQQNCTVKRVRNSSKDAELTASGKRYINQFLWQEGQNPPTPQP